MAGDPALGEEAFRTEEALTKVAKRTARALEDLLEGFSIEMDQEHGRWKMVFRVRRGSQILTTCIDREILRLPKFTWKFVLHCGRDSVCVVSVAR